MPTTQIVQELLEHRSVKTTMISTQVLVRYRILLFAVGAVTTDPPLTRLTGLLGAKRSSLIGVLGDG